MAASLGSLVVSLGLDAAEFVGGLTKADYASKRAMDNIGRGVDNAVKSLAALGVGVAALSVKLIDSAADLDDMAERTGASVEELSRLEQQARISGTALEIVESAIIKMVKGLNESDEGALKTQRAIAALGLSVQELREQDPALAFRTVAKALNEFKDSGAKSALAMDAMGKSASQVLPFLKDLANDAEVAANTTKEQAAAAEELGKSWRRMENDARNVAVAFALDLIPSLQKTIDVFSGLDLGILKLFETFNPFKETLRVLSILALNFAYTFNTIGVAAAGVGAQVEGFIAGGIEGFKKQRELVNQVLMDERKLFDQREAALVNAGKPQAPSIGATRDNWDSDTQGRQRRDLVYKDIASAKSAGEARLKLQESQAKIELAALKESGDNRQTLLDLQRQQNLISERDYWMQRIQIAKTTLDAELKVLDDRARSETTALQQTKAGTKDYYEAQIKLKETEAQRNKLIVEFGQFGKVSYEQAKIAAESYKRSVEDVNTRILEMTGNTVAAAKARADAQFEDLSARAAVNGDAATVAQINRLKELTVAQASFGAEQTRQSEITARLAIEEERIQNSQRTGAISEIEALQRTGAARAAAARELDATIQKLEEVARVSQNPALVLQAEQARAALEKLRSETDLLGEKFNTIFKDSAATNFADFIKGTKSAKEAFADFAASVANAITDLAAQQLATAIFGGGGKGGSGGGFGGFISTIAGFFGGGGGNASLAADTSLISNFSDLAAAGSFATGTPFVPRDQLAFIHRGERIVPAAQNRAGMGSGMNVTMNVTTRDAGSFRASRGQLSAQMASAVSAARRNL